MSISPQSLARTRDKRSHRIPARFDDFIPPEITYRNVPEVKQPASTPVKKVAEECNVVKKGSPFHPSITVGNRVRVRPSKNSTPIYGSSQTYDAHMYMPDFLPDTITARHDANFLALYKANIIERGKKKSSPIIAEISPPDVKKSVSQINETISPLDQTVSNAEKSKPPVEKSTLSVEKAKTQVEKSASLPEKSSTHPEKRTPLLDKSRTPSEKSAPLVERSKPLAEKKSASPANIVPPSKKNVLHPNDASKQSARKKSKGFSLMAKQTPPTNGAAQIISSASRTPHPQQQQTKYYNNLAQNMQYGTRLMLNEPIYLPRSVGTIAPMTTTLQQIANQARKPPFLTKKAEAYITYQEERKLNYIASTHTALVRITKYLEVQDLLNLRLVNKSWKSIIDCDEVWKKVTIKSAGIRNWQKFLNNILSKHQTSDLVFDRFNFDNVCVNNLYNILFASNIKRIWFRTADKYQNKYVLRFLWKLLNELKSFDHNFSMRIIWLVKVVVDPQGLALAPLGEAETNDECDSDAPVDFLGKEQKLYCYTSLDEKHADGDDIVDDDDRTILVELNDIDELFNGEKTKLALSKSPSKLSVHIGPA